MPSMHDAAVSYSLLHDIINNLRDGKQIPTRTVPGSYTERHQGWDIISRRIASKFWKRPTVGMTLVFDPKQDLICYKLYGMSE
jgi:hypothetical protein